MGIKLIGEDGFEVIDLKADGSYTTIERHVADPRPELPGWSIDNIRRYDKDGKLVERYRRTACPEIVARENAMIKARREK